MPVGISGKDKNKKELSVSVPEYLVDALAVSVIFKEGPMNTAESLKRARSRIRVMIKKSENPDSFSICRKVFLEVAKPSIARGMVAFEDQLDAEIQMDIEDL